MIIHILQTKSMGTKHFDIYFNKNKAYTGTVPRSSALASCQLLQLGGNVALWTERSKNYITHRILAVTFAVFTIALFLVISQLFPPDKKPLPLILTAVLVAGSLIIHIMLIDGLLKFKRKSTKVLGAEGTATEFYRQSNGFLYSYYVVEIDGKIYKLYNVSKGSVEYISIYLDDIQIGQINIDISKSQKKDYIIYLLDSFSNLGDMLSLFALYYHSINHANRGEIEFGKQRTWTYNRTNKFYNPQWLEDNFKDFL